MKRIFKFLNIREINEGFIRDIILMLIVGGYAIARISSAEQILSKQNTVPFILLFGVMIVIYIFRVLSYRKREEKLLQQSRTGTLYYKTKIALVEQAELIERFYSNKDYFKLLLSHLRFRTEVEKSKKIDNSHNGNWIISSLSMWDYFIYIFRTLMDGLIEKDEYLSLSIIDFWSKDKDAATISDELGVYNKHQTINFFETNFNKCSQGNVISKRIIIVNIDCLKRGKGTDANQKEALYYSNFNEILNKYANKDFNHKHFQNWFYLVSESIYENLVKEDIPFALVRRENYTDKLCISTYIPNFHSKTIDIDSKDGWRNGEVPKIGMHIAPDKNDKTWIRLHGKFDSIYNNNNKRQGVYLPPEELKNQLHHILK